MLFGIFIVVHVLICLLLMMIILMQSGRGGGLTENFSAAESMFGAKTNSVLVKGTTIFTTIFFVTCLTLAFLSSKQNKSLLSGKGVKGAATAAQKQPVGTPIAEPAAPAASPGAQPDQGAKAVAAGTSAAPATISSPTPKESNKPTEIKQATENANQPTPSAPQAEVPAKPQDQK